MIVCKYMISKVFWCAFSVPALALMLFTTSPLRAQDMPHGEGDKHTRARLDQHAPTSDTTCARPSQTDRWRANTIAQNRFQAQSSSLGKPH